MKLKTLDQELSVCKVVSISDIDLNGKFFFVGKTDEEISLECRRLEDFPDRRRTGFFIDRYFVRNF